MKVDYASIPRPELISGPSFFECLLCYSVVRGSEGSRQEHTSWHVYLESKTGVTEEPFDWKTETARKLRRLAQLLDTK